MRNECVYPDWEGGFIIGKHVFDNKGFCIMCGEINMHHLIICDGGYKNNLTYASFKVFDGEGNLMKHGTFVIGQGTNNVAEYQSLILALRWCISEEIKNVVVFMDSKLIINQVVGKWRCYNKRLLMLRKNVRNLLDNFENFSIKYMPNKYIKQKLGH
jgi:ribonuclease HI